MTSENARVPDAHLDEGDEAEGTTQFQCVLCSVLSPPTHTTHTLISAKHGWRLTRTRRADGSYAHAWHCASCFATLKAKQLKPSGLLGSSHMRVQKRG